MICSEGRFRRFIRGSKRRSCLIKLREDLNDTASSFLVSSVTTIQIRIDRVVRTEAHSYYITTKLIVRLGREDRSACGVGHKDG